ncbi:MAG: hypothetical protein N0E48_21110, partial [Candidatus Thiodiazotropha endolucinida]|nr:hypothetical protein [Candidatus Thiodiazotropha taylori]MCW4345834.1 hypothetical protein [Candidatus Thiodiazotropha endolucinida]
NQNGHGNLNIQRPNTVKELFQQISHTNTASKEQTAETYTEPDRTTTSAGGNISSTEDLDVIQVNDSPEKTVASERANREKELDTNRTLSAECDGDTQLSGKDRQNYNDGAQTCVVNPEESSTAKASTMNRKEVFLGNGRATEITWIEHKQNH